MSNFPPNAYQGAPMAAPPKKSNKTLWIILGVLGGLGVICCGGGALVTYMGYKAATGMVGELARQVVDQSPEVQAEIGTVQSVSLNLQKTGDTGNNTMVFDLVGSNGTAELLLQVDQGNQNAASAVLRTSDGREIPLEMPDLSQQVEMGEPSEMELEESTP